MASDEKFHNQEDYCYISHVKTLKLSLFSYSFITQSLTYMYAIFRCYVQCYMRVLRKTGARYDFSLPSLFADEEIPKAEPKPAKGDWGLKFHVKFYVTTESKQFDSAASVSYRR